MKSKLTSFFALFVLAAVTAVPLFAASGPAPAQIWIAPVDGRASIARVWDTGAQILDRTPSAYVVADARSAAALGAAGFDLAGPFALDPDRSAFLVHSRKRGGDLAALDGAQLATRGVYVVWKDDRTMLIQAVAQAADGPAPHFDADPYLESKRLRATPLARPKVMTDYRPKAAATTFEPVIQEMVDQVDSASYMQWIGNLAGSNPVTISGSPFTFTTRYTPYAQCDTAERYVFERFQAMGFTDVQFDPYSFFGIDARNVVAVLPGTVTPEQIYVLGGHLDSRATSGSGHDPAPGANDNASGAAAVLEAAAILANYQFESTIVFIAFTGEEQGLFGSEHYAAAADAAGDDIRGVVTCDMVAWWNNNYEIDIEGENEYKPLMQVMDDACSEYTGLATTQVFGSWGSDHVPFQDHGFPAFLAIEEEYDSYPCYHRACDTTGWNDGNFGVDVTRACLATVAHLAVPVVQTGVAAADETAPRRVALHANRPNPFNPVTTIAFDLPARQQVDLSIYDVGGRLVRRLAGGPMNAGTHELVWDGRAAGGEESASGIYFYRLETGDFTQTKKMILIR